MDIWINPACSKCHTATELLDAAGAEYTVRRYLQDPPTIAELTAVLDRLGLEPWDLVRLSEPVAQELGMADWPRDTAARRRWLTTMAANPALIQRPIITADDGRTAVARTPDAVREILDHSLQLAH